MAPDSFLPRGEAEALVAGTTAADAPSLELGLAYVLSLQPQDQVVFVRRPGGRRTVPKPWGGIARLVLPAGGTFRIGTTGPVWIDLLDGTGLVTALAHNSHRRSNGLHKSVDYVRPAAEALILQFSRAPHPVVRLAVRTLAQTPVRDVG